MLAHLYALALLAAPPPAPGVDDATAARLAGLALACVHQEYPNKIAHVLAGDADVRPPRELTPAFFGCYDWHSAVHGHWLLARLARAQPRAPWASPARAALARSLTAENLAAEARYLEGPGRVSFERPYGLAWLLQLAAELREWDAPEARGWAAALAPLERQAALRIAQWLPKLTRPVRVGEHSQTAFALGLVLDWAKGADRELAARLEARARDFYAADVDCPLAYEPSGEDFLSPCLAEADLMRRVLGPGEYPAWLARFLPALPAAADSSWLVPAVPSDRSDPKLAHLDGLNLSRAWMLEGIASGVPADDPRRAAVRQVAAAHRQAGLAAVTGEHYEGGHWLGTFAVYLVTGRGLGAQAPVEARSDPASAFAALVAEAWEEALREDPLLATQAGDRRYDDRLPRVSPADQARRAASARRTLAALQAIDRRALARRDQVTYDILARTQREALGELEHRTWLVPITNREGFHIDVARLPEEVPLATVGEYQAYLARLADFPRYAREQVANLRQGMAEGVTLPRVVLEGFDQTIRAHVKAPEETVFFAPLRRLPASFGAADRSRLAEEGRRVIADAVVPAYRELLEFMQGEYVPAARETVGASALPDGRRFYEHRVRMFTSLDATPEEVHRIGAGEVARIREEMDAVIARTGFQGDFAAFLGHLRSHPRFYASTPEDLLRQASWIAKRMDGQLPRLFHTLPRLPYGVAPIPDFIAPKTTAAYYAQPAGDGTRAGTYFVNTYDLSSRPLYVLEALTFHEAVPGHHLQLALQQEVADLPPLRRFVSSNAFVEGWALYAERLGQEAGFYEDPYSDFGRLTYEMWRACRLVVDTGLHALGWSRAQAIDFMAANTALSLHEVTTEIDRYIAWPGQALGYKMGELKIRELRRRAEAALGARFDLRAFHDVVLRNGSVPLDVLEEEVAAYLGEPGRVGSIISVR
ncbi:MAG TPA: DUF885 family protein [Vicinamibacteria bacterium]|nr:DUF885 family protein [Vicinamibacteria bacterium]